MQRRESAWSTLPSRTRRGAAAVGGAGLVVLILMSSSLASAGLVHPSGFAGATWTPSGSRYFSGCATSKMTNPRWSPTSGIGRWAGAAFASTCGAARGGSTVLSYAFADGGFTVIDPVAMTSGTGGVNVTLGLKLTGWDTAGSAAASGCPTTTSSANLNYGYTWFNYTYSYATCYALATVGVAAYVDVVDLTNGSYFLPSNIWSGLSNYSGIASYSYNDSWTYSNSSYWSYNGSYAYNSTYSYGPHGSISGAYAPQLFINGTFNASHTYALYVTVASSVSAEVSGFTSAHARAYYNAQTNGRHENLKSVVVW